MVTSDRHLYEVCRQQLQCRGTTWNSDQLQGKPTVLDLEGIQNAVQAACFREFISEQANR